MENEIWASLDFLGFPKYAVSNQGRLRGPRGILSGAINKDGYYQHILNDGKRRKSVLRHVLVATCFVPNPNSDKYTQVNHKNLNKLDCRAENLEWVTPKQNTQHSLHNNPKHTIGTNNGQAKASPEIVREMRKLYVPGHSEFGVAGLARKFGLSETATRNIVNGKWWKHVKPE